MNKNKKATILTHQGWADFYSSNGLINYYSSLYEQLIVLVYDQPRKKMVDEMFSEKTNVACIVAPVYTKRKTSSDTCIVCHTNHGDLYCPRQPYEPCKFVDYSSFSETEYVHIKIGCFKNFADWIHLRDQSISFSHAFYEFEKISITNRIENFHISKVPQKETANEEYIVYHDDQHRGILIPPYKLPDNPFKKIQLNGISDIMVDQVNILENAKEIHLIDSNYSVMVYFLSFKNKKIANVPKFLHTYTRAGRDTDIYRNPVPPNWYFLDSAGI